MTHSGQQRFVRAPYLLVYWSDDQAVCADAMAGRRYALPPTILRLLVSLGAPSTAAQITAEHRVPASMVQRLVDMALLIPEEAHRPGGPRWTPPELYFQRLSNSGGATGPSPDATPVSDAAATYTRPATGTRAIAGLQRARQKSVRHFSSGPIAVDDLHTIMRTAFGPYRGDDGQAHRPYPSGGGLYQVRAHVLLVAATGAEPGLYHYDPATDSYTPPGTGPHTSGEVIDHVRRAMGSPARGTPAAVVLLTCSFAPVLARYTHIGVGLVHKEAGAVLQLLSMATACTGLAGCIVGTLPDRVLASALPGDPMVESGLGAYAVGRPAGGLL
jgi:SagB-type dehydrogenase family enzyme